MFGDRKISANEHEMARKRNIVTTEWDQTPEYTEYLKSRAEIEALFIRVNANSDEIKKIEQENLDVLFETKKHLPDFKNIFLSFSVRESEYKTNRAVADAHRDLTTAMNVSENSVLSAAAAYSNTIREEIKKAIYAALKNSEYLALAKPDQKKIIEEKNFFASLEELLTFLNDRLKDHKQLVNTHPFVAAFQKHDFGNCQRFFVMQKSPTRFCLNEKLIEEEAVHSVVKQFYDRRRHARAEAIKADLVKFQEYHMAARDIQNHFGTFTTYLKTDWLTASASLRKQGDTAIAEAKKISDEFKAGTSGLIRDELLRNFEGSKSYIKQYLTLIAGEFAERKEVAKQMEKVKQTIDANRQELASLNMMLGIQVDQFDFAVKDFVARDLKKEANETSQPRLCLVSFAVQVEIPKKTLKLMQEKLQTCKTTQQQFLTLSELKNHVQAVKCVERLVTQLEVEIIPNLKLSAETHVKNFETQQGKLSNALKKAVEKFSTIMASLGDHVEPDAAVTQFLQYSEGAKDRSIKHYLMKILTTPKHWADVEAKLQCSINSLISHGKLSDRRVTTSSIARL